MDYENVENYLKENYMREGTILQNTPWGFRRENSLKFITLTKMQRYNSILGVLGLALGQIDTLSDQTVNGQKECPTCQNKLL